MGDLRALLREVEPRDFPLKEAWREVIRGLRERRRATGEAGRLTSWAAVERALAGSLRPGTTDGDLSSLKRALRAMIRDGAGPEGATRVDDLVARLLPPVVEGQVVVEITGWPDDFGPELQARLLRQGGPPPLTVDAEVAAALVREFDGFLLAGRTLEVRPQLRDDEVLPPVPRPLRSKPMRRGREGPWLPHHDEVGRRSLTPRALARRQARLLLELAGFEGLVIDGFCGLGGDAIAFAQAGARVIAVELDPGRFELARRNARAMGVSDRIDLRQGDIADLLPSLPPGTPLFLDPPWTSLDLDDLPLPEDRTVMLKLPREFPTGRLPGSWQVHYEFGQEQDDSAVVRMITVIRHRR